MRIHRTFLSALLFITPIASAQQSLGSRTLRDPFDQLEARRNQDAQAPRQHAPGQNTGAGKEATVSFQELAHKIPKPALKEGRKGLLALRKGDNQGAMKYFGKAVDIDPDFAAAQNNLGVVTAKLGRLQEAVLHFQKTIDLVPDHTLAVSNLSDVLFILKRYHEVCPVARRAVKLEPGRVLLPYILGMSLFAEHEYTTEAIQNLVQAAPSFPAARLAAAHIFASRGQREDAVRQLEEYARSVPKHSRIAEQVEAQLQRLKQWSPSSDLALGGMQTQRTIIPLASEVPY